MVPSRRGVKHISGSKKNRSSAGKDFFNSIRHKLPFHNCSLRPKASGASAWQNHRHEAVGLLKDVDGECADRTLPAYFFCWTRSSGYRVAPTDESTNRPISALGYATALSCANGGFPSRGVGSKKDATTARASTAPRRARSNREDYAEQKLALAVSNNVGVEIAKIFFVSMAYCLWCARRAGAFVAISTSYQGLS